MADSVSATGLQVQKWDDDYFSEYYQADPFLGMKGTGPGAPIQVKEDTVGRYKTITFALVNRLKKKGVTGGATLKGNEEKMTSRSFAVTVDKLRNGVTFDEIEEQYSAIDLRDAARDVLMDWSVDEAWIQRVIDALHSKNGVEYDASSEAQRDAWLVDNADRVLFGDNAASAASGDHSAGLGLCDTTDDLLTTALISRMRLTAVTAEPKIRPQAANTTLNRLKYHAFVHPRAMADLKGDTALQNAQREVSLREENARLFKGGDVLWDGTMVHEVERMPVLEGVGASGADVSPVFFIGAQAVGYALAKRWRSVTDTDDYEDQYGVAMETIDAIEKMRFGTGATDTGNPKDHGVLTAYVALATP